jgi:hypothetical protein
MSRNGRRAALAAALLTALSAPLSAQRGPVAKPTGLPEEVLALACGPKVTFDVPDQSLRITGGQDSFARRVWAPGDLVTVNAGFENGIEVGQQYFVRRLQTQENQRPTRETPGSIRTAGWIRIYATDPQMSLATVVHACDTIDSDDFLEPFVMPVVPKPTAQIAKPQKENYGRIMIGQDFRRTFGKNDMFIVDRGSDHGVKPGDRFVIYRERHIDENFLYELGEAVAVEVHPELSTLKAIVSRDAFLAGDYVAIRREPKGQP